MLQFYLNKCKFRMILHTLNNMNYSHKNRSYVDYHLSFRIYQLPQKKMLQKVPVLIAMSYWSILFLNVCFFFVSAYRTLFFFLIKLCILINSDQIFFSEYLGGTSWLDNGKKMYSKNPGKMLSLSLFLFHFLLTFPLLLELCYFQFWH